MFAFEHIRCRERPFRERVESSPTDERSDFDMTLNSLKNEDLPQRDFDLQLGAVSRGFVGHFLKWNIRQKTDLRRTRPSSNKSTLAELCTRTGLEHFHGSISELDAHAL
jgi:hypothetical protein